MAALAWLRPWMLWAMALAGALAWSGVQGWRLDRCKAASASLAAEHAALVAAANRQSAAVEEMERQAQTRLAEARKRAQAGERRAQAMDAQAAALRGAQAESCAAAVQIVREGLR